MKLVPEPEFFRAGLKSWAWRGALCAAPSFGWAVMSNFRQPAQIAEMVLGVVTYVVGFAWLTALPSYLERVQSSPFGWALRVAANLRAALAPLMFFGPDMFLGALAMGAVSGAARFFGARGDLPQAGVGWTYLTTVVQGALVSATMLLLALAIWGGREAYSVLRRGNRIAIAAQPRDGGSNGSV